jgi:hypothetical protein
MWLADGERTERAELGIPVDSWEDGQMAIARSQKTTPAV